MSSRESSGIHSRRACAAPRLAKWGAFARGLLPAAALSVALGAALTSGPALADYGNAAVREVLPSTITVKSNGADYTNVQSGQGLLAEIKYYFNTQGSGGVKSFSIWLRMRSEHGDWEQFRQNNFSRTFPIGKRDDQVFGDKKIYLPQSSYSSVVTSYCNEHAETLRHIGMTDEQIFSQDRSLEVAVDTALEYEMTSVPGGLHGGVEWVFGFGGPDWPTATKFTVNCEKSAPPPPAPPAITGAAVVVRGIDPANSQGKCRMRLNGTLISNVPNVDVTFRYVDDKGNQSDLKTVNTSDDRSVSFEHDYPLNRGQKRNAKIRIVGESLNFTSAWKDFDYECEDRPIDSLTTVLPPEVVHLEVGATAKKGVYRGHVCPAEAKIIGVFKGRGSASGTAVLTVNNVMQVERAFSIDDKESKAVDYVQSLSWAGIDGPLQQDIDVGLVLQNANGEPVDVLTKTQTVSCVEADKPDQFVSNDPTPPVLSLSMRAGERRLYQGYMCPEQVILRGRIHGQDDFNGQAVFVVEQEQPLAIPQSQEKEFDFAVTENENLSFVFEPEVRWSNVPTSGDAPPKQTMDLSFRVVKTGGVVASVERSLEVQCEAVTVANLAISFDPPKATGLAAVAKADEVFLQGHICPASISIGGVFKGQGSASGTAVLTANGVVKAEMPYSVEDGQTMSIAAEHDLNWANVQDPVQNNVSLALRLYDADGGEVDALTKGQTFECRKYTPGSQVDGAPDGVVSVLPPKPIKLIFVVDKEVQYQDLVCPVAVTVIGRVEGRGKVSGTITLGAAGDQILEKPFSFEDDETQNFVGEYGLYWDVETATERDVAFTMFVHNALGEQVGALQQMKTFECQSYRDGRRVVSGLSTGEPTTPTAQQGRTPAATGRFALQTGPAFAIQAPKGRVRQGQIQLSGGPANAKYDLRFYRKTEGGYRSLRSAQLPRQMTGRTATFNLKALSGSRDWRIEVCPAGSKAKTACKTSDFRIARIGAAGKPAAPGTPGEAKVFILPGSGN